MKHCISSIADAMRRPAHARIVPVAEVARLWTSLNSSKVYRHRLLISATIACNPLTFSPLLGSRRCGLWMIAALVGLLVTQSARQACWAESATDVAQREHILVVVGAGGTAEYAHEFASWAADWQSLAHHRGWELTLIDGESTADSESAPSPKPQPEAAQLEAAQLETAQPTEPATSRQQLQRAIEEHADCDARLWVVMLGHGTAVGDNAKFNLPGPDVSAQELSVWLDPLRCPVVVINCSSASGPFLPTLSRAGRIVITATRSGSELNYSRFGKYLAASLQDLSADLDHDLEVSLLEAFLTATARTQQFYLSDARLASEHALLDDNGDGRGTSGEFFRGLRPIQAAEAGQPIDGQRAARAILFSSPLALQFTPAQQAERESIESRIDALRQSKALLDEARYYQQLEALLLELSALYDLVGS